ncbi:MAG: dihydrolipoyl dehydrogenase [Christensenellales bacterium]|jgi:dihydrolipoamide dehydrogenase
MADIMNSFDILILGGGPAGYVAAERAGSNGLKVCLFEKRSLGGVCLNEGCIPSKALLNSAKIYENALNGKEYGVFTSDIRLDHGAVIKRKSKVVRKLVGGVKLQMKGANVNVVDGEGIISGKTEQGFCVMANGEKFYGKNLIIATGSSPSLPPIQGLKGSLESGFALTNREILDIKEVPERLAVVGGGVIGLEMAAYYNAAGSKVTVIEMLDHIAGFTESEVSAMLLADMKKQGVEFMLGARVTAIENGKVSSDKGDVTADKVLVSIGRRANTQGAGLESLGVYVERGAVVTDERMMTNVPGVYAAGDVNGKSMLAHTAYREAEVAVNNIMGRRDIMRYDAIPAVIYTHPEVAGVGHTLESAKSEGIDAIEAKLPMAYSGRFVAENTGEGICKVIVDKKNSILIGVHMLGTYSSEIIYGAAAMIEMQLRVDDIKEIVFPHPTVAEIIRETIFTV